MAIQPPSDILLDVANAADPAKVRMATARLAKLAADPAAANDGFGKALAVAHAEGKAGVDAAAAGAPAASTLAPTPHVVAGGAAPSRLHVKGAADAYQKFEGLLLQNFVESILPKDDELYGDKNSAGVYRSMMAEQFANQLSKAGGIGIAKAIAARHPAPDAQAGLAAAGGVKPTLTRDPA